ncbi:MAG: sulfatase family protein [Opitutaceae bacterium]
MSRPPAVSMPALTKSAESKPNILWLTSEDNSASWIGCYGNPHSETPNIDQLARDGFQYMHTYANAPVCAPSRSTWITGVMALSMGTHPMRSYYRIPHDKIRLYPDFLNDNGYYTGNWKKTDYNLGGRENEDCWDNSKEPDWGVLKANQPFFQVINHSQSHESKAFGDIENTEHDPANTTLAAYHPDVPTMRKNYAHYYDAIKAMDAAIGKSLSKLEAAGLADDTIVVYVSDHGGVFPRSKRFLFQNSLHCPLVIRIPEKYKHLWPADQPGTQIDRLVSFVDMPKTWLSITGSTVPDTMQGNIFLGADAEPGADYHFGFRGRMDERLDNARVVSDKRYLYIRSYMPYLPWVQKLNFMWRIPATQAWEQAVKDGTANEVQSRFFAAREWTEELYDMQNDPDNINNLVDSPEYKQVVKRMRQQMRQQQLAIYDSGLIPETERARLADENDTTIYELVRDPKLYDVAALLDAADLAMEEDPANVDKLHKLIQHRHLGMRYWGVVGCILINDQKGGLLAIEDESHEVRAMAAWLLIQTGKKDPGLACLNDLIQQHSYALVTVFNIADWIGDDAEALLPEMKKLNLVEKWKNQFKYEIRMRDNVLEKFDS